jgi:hypothetical protein
MSGTMESIVWGGVMGFGPFALFSLYALRFTKPARRAEPPIGFWRLLARVYVQDIGIWLCILAPFLAGGVVLIESSVGWIGAALGGLAYLAFMVALGAGTTPTHDRSYWGCILGIELMAIAVLAVLKCLAQLQSWPRGSGVLIAVLAFGLLAAACSLSSRCQRKPIGFVLPK